uniref:(northern house mosquito) hypothetical protein n=1 Tax=Culex pipiens TaxID=7175 RepID=A0A8D8EUT6_CULPI
MALQNKTKKKHVRVLCVVFGRCFCESVFVQTTLMIMMAITNEECCQSCAVAAIARCVMIILNHGFNLFSQSLAWLGRQTFLCALFAALKSHRKIALELHTFFIFV